MFSNLCFLNNKTVTVNHFQNQFHKTSIFRNRKQFFKTVNKQAVCLFICVLLFYFYLKNVFQNKKKKYLGILI